jgi:microcystin-dependent protein
MPRQSNGNYIQPANTAAVSGAAISSVAFNTLETDIGTELTNSLDRLGRSAMQAALPMGSNKITGMADPTVSTDGATKNYVDTTTAAFFSTGDFKPTIKTTADSGWVMCDDGTFGSASSGSSSRANADTQALFTLFFNNLGDLAAPLLTSGGGATTRAAQTNAATAWAANCRMLLPKMLGRAIGAAGAGSGLTGRILGTNIGEEAHLLVLNEIPTGIASNNASQTIAANPPAGTALPYASVGSSLGNSTASNTSAGANNMPVVTGGIQWQYAGGLSTVNSISVTSNNTGGAVHNNMQPTTFINWMIKL